MVNASGELLMTPEDTYRAGVRLGEQLGPGDVVGLTGTLGAGKTHFTKGIVAGLGSADPVTSPTFGLVHEYYSGRLPVYHFDFYRIGSISELADLGWDDYLEQEGVVIVEWADLYAGVLPEHAQWWRLDHEKSGGRRLQRLQ